MPKRHTESFFIPHAPTRTAEEWLAMEPGFAAREREAYEWVFTEVWLMAMRLTAHAFRGRANRKYHDVADLSGEATAIAMPQVLRWEPGKECCLRVWAYHTTLLVCRKVYGRWSGSGGKPLVSLHAENDIGRQLWEIIPSSVKACPIEASERTAFLLDALDRTHPDFGIVIKRHYGIGSPRVRQEAQATSMGLTKQAVSLRLKTGIKRLAKRFAEAGITLETI